MPIVRRNNCVYATLGTCYSVWMTIRLWAHHQKKQLCLCDTWYLLFCVDKCPVCRSICSCIPDSHPHRITSTKCCINRVVSPDDGPSCQKHVEIDKYKHTKKMLCTKLVLFTRLNNDAWSTKHKKKCAVGFYTLCGRVIFINA